MFLLETSASLPAEGMFVLAGIAVLVILYFALSAIKAKKKEDKPEENASELAEEPEKEEPAESFRPVVFVRTNKRRVDGEEEKKEDVNNEAEESNA